ncbi:MAG: ATP-dependent Clp protease ATP-binding subunit, partial [Oscillospiraceae bacterium]|nr:ATP-dependent Clp protease ATP-binding subunit [Oscillospiraceae bacterium]
STSKDGSYGFGKTDADVTKTKTENALKELFRPEFLNRVDETIIFNQLDKSDLILIAELMLKDIEKGLAEKDIKVSWGSALVSHIVEKGYDPKFGARPMRRVIKKEIEPILAQKILDGEITEHSKIKVDHVKEKVEIS